MEIGACEGATNTRGDMVMLLLGRARLNGSLEGPAPLHFDPQDRGTTISVLSDAGLLLSESCCF